MFAAVEAILRRKGSDADAQATSALFEDLDLDSLEVAELSATLEDELGVDPFSEGLAPRTVGEVIDFYR